MMEALFFRINHKNTLQSFDNDSLIKIKTNLYEKLSSNEDKIMNLQEKEFIPKILNSTGKDKLELIYELSLKFIQSINYDVTQEEENLNLLQQVSIRNFKMQFEFNEEFVNDIALILSIGMHKIKNKSFLKEFTYKEFKNKINDISYNYYEIISLYRQYTKEKDTKKYPLPNEFIFLIYLFQGIKKLNIFIENSTPSYYYGCLLLLLNTEWLFPYVFEIKFDLCSEGLIKEVEGFYKTQLKEEICNETTGNEEEKENENTINDKITEKENALNKIVSTENYKMILSLIILYSFYLSGFKYLRILEMIIPSSYKKEIERFLSVNEISELHFNILDYLFGINTLSNLSISFNPLENDTFDKILSIFQNNSNLRNLCFNFFLKNEDFFSTPLLVKVAEENCMDVSSIFRQNLSEMKLEFDFEKNKKNNFINEQLAAKYLNSFQGILANKFISYFEERCELFFILLQSKKNLDYLELNFDLPSVIKENEKYFLIFMKLIFNLFVMLNREKLHLKGLKIVAPYLKFDNTKNLLIESFLDCINLFDKNQCLTQFTFQVQITSINNYSNILSKNIKDLFLGDFDVDTFMNFIEFYLSDAYLSQSVLEKLTISMKKTVYEIDDCKAVLKELIQGDSPKNLKEIGFLSNIPFSCQELKDMLLGANGNKIRKYKFLFKQDNPEEFLSFDYDSYWYADFRDFMKYLPVLKKFNFLKEKKISKTLVAFLINKNKKDIEILKE